MRRRYAVGLLGWMGMALAASGLAAARPAAVAPRPPMGWNSWDAYGFTVDEAAFKANAERLARWRALGWTYAVIDEGWYMGDPLGRDLAARRYRLDAWGRLDAVPDRFRSSRDGRGLAALADWTHARGLKFGVHIVRGIPKAAVEANLPIAGSRFRAADAADREALCPWDDGNYGIADTPAGQAWYDALLAQYAEWGVDFLKVDCIADHPYRPTEIAQIGRAIAKAGRPMVLSLSPGPARVEHLEQMAASAQMWRIADDFWDGWTFPHTDPNSEFPVGVRDQFDRLALWNPHSGPERWADADMLPFGSLRPHPGWGDPRETRLSAGEVRSAFVLWSIARSPLILGGDLPRLDAETEALLTNRAVIALDQEDRQGRPVAALPPGLAEARAWISSPRGKRPDTLAVFNLGAAPLAVDAAWSAFGLRTPARVCDLLTGRAHDPRRVAGTVASHDVLLLGLDRAAVCGR